jgi:hypothetical protein
MDRRTWVANRKSICTCLRDEALHYSKRRTHKEFSVWNDYASPGRERNSWSVCPTYPMSVAFRAGAMRFATPDQDLDRNGFQRLVGTCRPGRGL